MERARLRKKSTVGDYRQRRGEIHFPNKSKITFLVDTGGSDTCIDDHLILGVWMKDVQVESRMFHRYWLTAVARSSSVVLWITYLWFYYLGLQPRRSMHLSHGHSFLFLTLKDQP